MHLTCFGGFQGCCSSLPRPSWTWQSNRAPHRVCQVHHQSRIHKGSSGPPPPRPQLPAASLVQTSVEDTDTGIPDSDPRNYQPQAGPASRSGGAISTSSAPLFERGSRPGCCAQILRAPGVALGPLQDACPDAADATWWFGI